MGKIIWPTPSTTPVWPLPPDPRPPGKQSPGRWQRKSPQGPPTLYGRKGAPGPEGKIRTAARRSHTLPRLPLKERNPMRPRFFPLALALSVLLALPAAAFSDVPADTWYASSAAQCQQAGLLKGTSSDTFSPDKTVTLAEVMTVAARLSYQQSGGNGDLPRLRRVGEPVRSTRLPVQSCSPSPLKTWTTNCPIILTVPHPAVSTCCWR